DAGIGSHFDAIAVDHSYVYVTDNSFDTLMRVPQDPGSTDPAIRIARTRPRAVDVQVDGDFLFWGDSSYLYRTLRSAPSAAPDLLANARVMLIALDASQVYYVTGELLPGGSRASISRIPKLGFGQPEVFSAGWGSIDGLAVDDRAVYFATEGKIVKLAK